MNTNRRGVLGILAGALATAFGSRCDASQTERRAPRIHSATENVLLGPVGERHPKLSSAPPDFKPYPGRPRLALAGPGVPRGAPLPDLIFASAPSSAGSEAGSGSLSASELARLLYFTNGATGSAGAGKNRTVLRAAPSAGALYAGEVYVVAEEVDGVPPGIYSYAVAEHELVRLREGSFRGRVAEAAQRPQRFETAAAVVLLTCVFGRYTWRYANRGYRYALIDTGHISENLRLAAQSAGLAEATELHFVDAELDELLGVDGRSEAVCAVHAIGRRGPRASQGSGKVRALVELQSAGRAAPSDSGSITFRYHRATTLLRAPPQEAAPSDAGELPASGSRNVSTGAKRRAAIVASAEQAIALRRSPLKFREAPIERDELEFISDLAIGRLPAPELQLHVIAHRVRGLAAGAYRVDPSTRELVLLQERNLVRALTRACRYQEHAQRAAAAFLMVARFPEGAPPLGDRRYRDLLMASGALGERIYLAAESVNLAARNLAAFTDSILNELVGLDARREGVVHLTVVGHPADA